MRYTRRNYQDVADILFEARQVEQTHLYEIGRNMYEHEGIIARQVALFAGMFERDNPRFSRERFDAAVYRDYQEAAR